MYLILKPFKPLQDTLSKEIGDIFACLLSGYRKSMSASDDIFFLLDPKYDELRQHYSDSAVEKSCRRCTPPYAESQLMPTGPFNSSKARV